MNKFNVLAITTALTLCASHASANLVPIGVLPSTGNGLGTVFSSLTFQNTGAESGCISYSGVSTVTGSGACPAGFTGGNETTVAGNNIFTTADLGFSNTIDFRNLVLIFNGNEGGGADASITLNSLGLSLYSSTGTRLITFTAPALPINYASLPGIGNAGYAFALDATEAAQANALLAGTTSTTRLRLGTEANVTGASAGPETIQLATVTNTGVGGGGGSVTPEPGTMVMLGSGLLFAGLYGRKRRSSSQS